MGFEIKNVLKHFHIVGISYSRTPVAIRELFSISESQQQLLLEDAKSLGLDGFVVLSTCNRTEIYTQSNNSDLIKRLLVKYSKGSATLLEEYGYTLSGEKAVNHLYRVGAGLDSQILGDFQIIGQLKSAYRMSEKHQMVNTLLNRMFSHVFQASKKIKNQTELSNGAASVSHAAVQYIKENVANLDTTNFLLYGTGEIGKITCDNLVRHMNKHSLTLINRTQDKATVLAEKYDLSYKPEAQLTEEIAKADVIIVATGAHEPTVTQESFPETEAQKLVLDLSVPRNVSQEVATLPCVKLVDIDELSQVSNEVLQLRQKSVPLAQQIIRENYEELHQWLEMQHLSPIFESVKKGLNMLKEQEMAYHRIKLTDDEYDKVNVVATNIVNRIAKMSILHIKDVFKTEKGSREMLAKMFQQYANQPEKGQHPHGHPHHHHKKPHHEN